MGGAAGHMNHLYDNPALSFDEMISVMKSASKGKLKGTEKLDGVNVFIGYNAGVAKAARNVADIAKGGMDLEALLAREFKGGPKMQQVYVNTVKAFDLAVKSLSDEERLQIFGANGEKFYNGEILHTDAKNVVSYSGDVLSIHRQGHKHLDGDPESETHGKVVKFNAGQTAAYLDAAISKFEIALAGKEISIGIKRAAIQNLQELGNKEALNVAIAKIKKAIGDAGVGSSDTIGDYLKAKTAIALTDIPDEHMDTAVKRMVGELAWRSPEINSLPKDVKAILSGYWKQAKPIHERSIYPIEEAVHEFSVEMLKGMESAFIIDNNLETESVRSQVRQAKEEIESYISQGLQGSERAGEILTKQLAKLKDVDRIDTAVEGFVFEHNEILYKFTGNFAPINQILGLWKWGRGKQVPSISDALKDQPNPEEDIKEAETPNREAKRVAVVPGGFKPPHAGHFLGAKWFLEPNGAIEPADEVHILISPVERMGHSKDGRDGRGVKIDKNMSQKLWQLYIKEAGLAGKMKAYITDNKSPVGAAYDFMASMQPDQTLLLGSGAKDSNDHRFDRAQAWSDKKGYQVDVEVINTPMMAGGVSGTDMRRYIADGDYDSFAKYVPLQDATTAWKIVRPDLQESQPQGVAAPMPFLYGLIEEVLKEVESEKQRRWACAQTDDEFKGEKKLTKQQAEEMCSSEIKEEEELEEISAMSAGSVEIGATGTKKKKPYDVWGQSEYEKELMSELALKPSDPEDADVIDLDYGLKLSRTELPQIKSTDVEEFMEWLEMSDIAVEEDPEFDPKELTPIQKEINLDKVAGMVANKGLKALANDKPVMISGDNYLIDGHHRWYALIDSDYPTVSVVRIGLGVHELIDIIKGWEKTSYRDITDTTAEAKLAEQVMNYIIKEEDSYEKLHGKYVLDLRNMNVTPTKHGEERRFRHKQDGKGMTISKQSIVKAVDTAMGDIMNDFMNGELANEEPFLIRAKQGSQPALNIVGVLNMQPGPDSFKVITVMRKDDFKTDSFNSGGKPQREYGVSI
jgi:hypothetical protein